MTEPSDMSVLLSVRSLRTEFSPSGSLIPSNRLPVIAVDGVSFDITKGTCLGIVGESGCGKTTLGRSLLRIIEPQQGQVLFDGIDIRNLSQRQLRQHRRDMQLVFQDPYGSLDPRMTIGASIEEPLVVHREGGREDRRKRVAELLDMVGLQSSFASRYPHELSGGQRQRVCIARAIALSPRFIVCDEPVSALDVSVQSQVLNLLTQLQRELGLTYLFISHNLAVVRHIADRIAVMYLGRIVEIADAADLFERPQHPYTVALLAAVPGMEGTTDRTKFIVPGDPPDPSHRPSGCQFHPRCPFATEECRRELPKLEGKTSIRADHLVACHYAGNFAQSE